MDIDGLYVGQLTPEELRWFEAEIRAGRARRSYTILGVSKVVLIPERKETR
jgi:hypothetical protein